MKWNEEEIVTNHLAPSTNKSLNYQYVLLEPFGEFSHLLRYSNYFGKFNCQKRSLNNRSTKNPFKWIKKHSNQVIKETISNRESGKKRMDFIDKTTRAEVIRLRDIQQNPVRHPQAAAEGQCVGGIGK